ncbi:MAG TPA: serine protease [Thermoanaerobaculia bacterium]
MICLIAVVLIAGWALPAAAGGRSYDEMPMSVVTKGLRAEQHLQRQAELSRRLALEMPANAAEKAVRVPLTSDEVNAIENAPRAVSPLKIGLVKAMNPGIVVSGLRDVERTADGGAVWATVVKSEGAGAIRLHVQDMSLPANAELYVYSRAGQAYGPYTLSGSDFSGDFWTTALFSSEVILQVRLAAPVSDADLRAVTFRVQEAGLITAGFTRGLLEPRETQQLPWQRFEKAGEKAVFPCGNANCMVDATCSNVAAANPAKLAVAKMEWISGSFIFTCTGGLINDNNPTQNNFFLTANHCLSANKAAKNVSFYWRFATSVCNGTCPVNTGWPFVTTGSTVAASNRRGDYTLLQLNTAPPAGSVLLGWNSTPVANTNGAQLYRISNPIFQTQVYSQHNVDTATGTCTGWPRGERIYSRDITGATDGGSSGSPVVNASTQVVGQLSGACGFDVNNVCAGGPGEANATVDGAFAYYYPSIQSIINP